MNNLSLAIVCIVSLFTLAILYFLGIALVELFRKERKFVGNGKAGALGFIFSLVVMGGLTYCFYRIPYVFFGGMSWAFIEQLGPMSLIAAVMSFAIAIPIFYLYFIFTSYFVKPNEKPFFVIIVLSILSGLGNSLLIMVINEALNRNLSYLNKWVNIDSGLYFYFLMGIILFIVSALIVRKRLINLTNDLLYEKRMAIINKILNAPFDKLETLEKGKIDAVLNNDTEVMSGFINSIVNCITGLITLISCLIYLGVINVWGLLVSVVIICLTCGLFLSVSLKAEKIWEKSRDIQTTFFKFIHNLIYGYKELYINPDKRAEFREDIRKSCKMYRDTRVQGEFKFIGASLIGELLFTIVIGVVLFTFSIFFSNIQGNTLRTYVLVYLYMGGIVTSQIYLIPGFVRILISWRRINELIKELSAIENGQPVLPERNGGAGFESLELKNVTYQYKHNNGEQFTVGPVNYRFQSGMIYFITGGNGSGKSTVAKLLTGIYRPDEGEIEVNGNRLDSRDLGPYFSTVFSDYYLFEKLYGIKSQTKEAEIQKYLKLLKLEDKLQVKDGQFSTVMLSSGQRKRIALLISYLEDHPILLFDEWAADQDPEFRKFFYEKLLPEFKARGKAIIAITHDDRYFHVADQILKMEMGQVSLQSNGILFDNQAIASGKEN